MGKVRYKDIIDLIKNKIANGEWPIGSKLPSQRKLSKQFSVNRSTVITALEELAADGLIEAKIGMGTIVVNNTWSLMGQGRQKNWNENVHLGIHQASISTVQKINMEESNPNYLQLSKGELSKDIFPLEQMKMVIQKIGDQLLPFGYEEPKGNPDLRQVVCDYLKNKGIQTSPSSILIVSGALQALQLISIGLLEKGSTVFLEKPSYLYSLSTFQSAGMKLAGVSMDDEGLLPRELINKNNKKQKSILYTIPNFHNPTGIMMSQRRRKEIVKLAENEQLPVIEDDVYGDLWIDHTPPLPLKANDQYGNILYVGSLSKSLTPGLRIGWLVGPEPVIDRLADLKMQTDYGSSSLSQRAAFEWLSSGLYDRHLAHVREQLKVRRERAILALNRYIGESGKWEVPNGGFFIWVKLFTDFSMRDIYTRLLKKGILVNPGNIYSQSSPATFRISYANASLAEIESGIQTLGLVLKGER